MASMATIIPIEDGEMIRYWLPVRLLAYDVPHRITGRGVILVMGAK